MIPLKDLLTRAMQRAKVSTQVSASQVVSVANEYLTQLMGSRRADARAASYKDQILTIETLRASTSEFVHEHEQEILQEIHTRIPSQKVRTIRYRIVHRFRGSEL